MMRKTLCLAGGLSGVVILALLLARSTGSQPQGDSKPPARPSGPPDDGKLRIICFGAHPDDCELKAGGVAALWSAQGNHVKFLSVPNSAIGHWREAGGPLARRRTAEVERAAHTLGITTEVLDIHDGEL